MALSTANSMLKKRTGNLGILMESLRNLQWGEKTRNAGCSGQPVGVCNRKYKITVGVLCRKHVWRKRNRHERRRHFLAIVSGEVFRVTARDYRRSVSLFYAHQHCCFGRFRWAFRFLRRLGSAYRLVPACGQASGITGFTLFFQPLFCSW